jgi:CheY-like chemotaxis protein
MNRRAAARKYEAETGDGLAVPALADAARVLVAEDHELGRELVGMMVQRLGARADGAEDGQDALAKVEAAEAAGQPYAMVLMDFMMPVLDGVEATRRLRERGFTASRLPVVAITANAENQDVARFMAAGGQAYLPKPINLAGLGAVFKAWLPGEHVPSLATTGPTGLLGQRYQLRKWAMVDTIDATIASNTCSRAKADLILDMLHKIAGTAGFFGDEALSAIASEFETSLLRAKPGEIMQTLKTHRGKLDHAL